MRFIALIPAVLASLRSITIFRGRPFTPKSPGEKLGRSRPVAPFGQHEIKSSPELVDGAVKVNPLAVHLDVGLVHAPRSVDRCLSTLSCTCDHRRELGDPTVERHMINRYATLGHYLF